jgi:aspartate/methionine/tyrosine aminotransferase
MSGHDFMRGLFEAQRVSVIDGGAFGPGTRGFVRLCFATEEAELAEAIARIRRYCNELSR